MSRRLGVPLLLALPLALGAATPGRGGPEPEPVVPERGVAIVLETVSGDVAVRRAGATRYRRLAGPRRMPVGVVVDAREGAVRLTVARDDAGGTSQAVFSEGKFVVTQPRVGPPLTTLELAGRFFADQCAGDDAVASGRKPRPKRRLWGDGKGSFRTSGRYAAATVRGTRWLTEDRCDGTLTRVVRGEVDVEDFTYEPPPPPPTAQPAPPAPGPAPGSDEGGAAPGVSPVTDGSGADVRVSAGGTYVARP